MIGVTDEDPELVETFLRRCKPTFPIVITGNGGFDKALGVQAFPTHAVFAPDGKLAYAGHSAESALSDALGRAKKGPLYSSKLRKIAEMVRDGEVAKAYAEVRKLQDAAKEGGADALWLPRFCTWIEDRAAADVAAARAFAVEGLVHRAHRLTQPYALSKPALPVAEEAAAFVKELEARPAFQEELKAGPLFDEAEALAEARDYTAAVEGFRKVYKKHGSTSIAELARTRAKKIVDDGLPGMNTDCEDCAKAKRACKKHHEEVKL